jgi:hypothetical protein
VVAGGYQGAVHDEHGVSREAAPGLKRQERTEVVDDAVGSGLGDAEQRGKLTHRQHDPEGGGFNSSLTHGKANSRY